MELFENPNVVMNAVIFIVAAVIIILLGIQYTLNQILQVLKQIRQEDRYRRKDTDISVNREEKF